MVVMLLLLAAVVLVVLVVMVVVMAFSMNPSFLSPDSLRGTLIPDRKGYSFSLGLSLCPKENRISAQSSFSQSEEHRRKYQWSQLNFYQREGFFSLCLNLTFIGSQFTSEWGHCIESRRASVTNVVFHFWWQFSQGKPLTLNFLSCILLWGFLFSKVGLAGQGSWPNL